MRTVVIGTSSGLGLPLVAVTPRGRVENTLSGQYGDMLEKAGGVWRFTDRLITVDLGAGFRA
jgi:hypothetical protein